MYRYLKIDIASYWHPGTGRGQGSELDAKIHCNAQHLPVLPGRSVKGLLRDAVYRWEAFGGFGAWSSGNSVLTDALFGPYGEKGEATWPGLLRVSDAGLRTAEQAYLADPEHLALQAGLYQRLFNTAIEHKFGTAKKGALRGMEVVVPLVLWAKVEARQHTISARENKLPAQLLDTWPQRITEALPLLRAVGAHRSRGLGRAVVHLQEEMP